MVTDQESSTENNSHLEGDYMNEAVTIQDVKAAIKQQKTGGKSQDSDNIHPTMLKHMPRIAIEVLCKLINLALETGVWPWSRSRVTFLRKDGKPNYNIPGAYRPISMSSYIGKVAERILEQRLRRFCTSKHILDESQEGFRCNRSTTRYLYSLVASLHEVKRKKLTAIVLFIDFEKAFDSVSIEALIVKLYRYGIKGRILRLLHRFLCNRQVHLMVNDYKGIDRLCKLVGLPQGSVLSPLLFIIFISDMLDSRCMPNELMEFSQVHKFADDGTVISIAKDIKTCQQQMQKICNYLKTWCSKWKMVINCAKNKTEAIIIQPKSKKQLLRIVPNLEIGSDTIQYVEKTKVLGVTLDSQLNFSAHASSIISSCWYVWYRLKQNSRRSWGLNIASMTTLFKTLVLSKLLYASPVWLDQNLNHFKDFWSRAILGLTGSEYYPKSSIASLALKLPPLEIQHQMVCLKFLLKCLSGSDGLRCCVLQLDENPKHPFYKHCLLVKQYWGWKNVVHRSNVRNVNLIDIDTSQFMYIKEQMKIYSNTLWKNRPDLLGLHKDEEWMFNETTFDTNWLFKKNSYREIDSVLMDFIHGHALRFNNFAAKVKDRSNVANPGMCKFCKQEQDSPCHQLFSCRTFECEERSDFIKALHLEISDFPLSVILSTDPAVTSGFKSLVSSIMTKTADMKSITCE